VNVIAARVLGVVVRENEEGGMDGERGLPRDRWG
jgi:hypothetical protein